MTGLFYFIFISLLSRTICFPVTNSGSTAARIRALSSFSTQDGLTFSFSQSTFQRRGIIMMGQRGKRIKKEIKKEREMEAPPRINTPYGPIRYNRPLAVCDTCSGRGVVRCNVCEGRGVIRKTGQRKRNALNINRVIGSRWTSVEIRCGHRQYVVTEQKGSRKKKNLELRVSNTCGPEEKRVHLWITEDEIRDKSIWRMGWTTLEEIKMADRGALIDAKVCFRCKGESILKCLDCDGKGKVGYHQKLYD